MKMAYNWKHQAIQQMTVGALLGILLGAMCLFLDPRLVAVSVVGIIGAIALFRYPEAGILAIVLFLSSVLSESSMPVINIGQLGLYITDAIAIWLFVILIIRLLLDPSYKLQLNAVALPLLLFIGWVVISAVVHLIQNDLVLGNAIYEIRIISYYLLFFVLINLIKTKQQVNRLLNGIFILATITSLANLTQYALGRDFTLLSGRVEAFSHENTQMMNVTRITDNPGEGLITSAFIILTVKLFLSQFKFKNILAFLQWVVIGGAFLVSFNRTHWGVAAISILITLFLIKPDERKKMLTWLLYISWIIPLVLLPALIAPNSGYGQLINAALLRFSTLFTTDAYASATESTIVWRNFEYQYGIPQILKHPVLGVGPGANYRPFLENIDYPEFAGQRYSHNGHLWIAVKTGLPGWFFALSFLITFIVQGFKNWRKILDVRFQSIYLGFTLVGLSVLLASILHPIIITIFWTPLLGISLGINPVLLKLYGSTPPEEVIT